MNLFQNGFDLLNRGGWVMYPLLGLSIIAFTVMLERGLSIREAALDAEKLFAELEPLLKARRFPEALQCCQNHSGPVATILATGIANRTLDFPDIERAMEELALRETPLLQQRLGMLDTIITMAPLLGLLGTITGMIRAFNVVAGAGSGAPTAITGGVAEALIATATGLTIAIVTLPIYNYLTERVSEIISEMEVSATRLLNILTVIRYEDAQKNRVVLPTRPLIVPAQFENTNLN
ncbi:MotA/TolQ/ExbB proton channel family protein [bacterium]|nr:MAG: MotA/TolQ/ExbB proton channel family protein [bacterium]